MKNNFTDDRKNNQEIPEKVRQALEASYQTIRRQEKRKRPLFNWAGLVAAAGVCLAVGTILLTNSQVMASMQELFGFGDRGVEQAIAYGHLQENESAQTDKDIAIALDKYIADQHKLVFSLQLAFADAKRIADMTEITVDYRLKNGDGEYIDESVPDTKPLYGENEYISSINTYNDFINEQTGEVGLEIMLEAYKASLPQLKDAVLEIESLNFYDENGYVESLEGNWVLEISNTSDDSEAIEYTMENKESSIDVIQATASTTALRITFAVAGEYEDENVFAHNMFLQDEQGNKYASTDGFNMKVDNGQTIISTTFPITVDDRLETLLFEIVSLDGVVLKKE